MFADKYTEEEKASIAAAWAEVMDLKAKKDAVASNPEAYKEARLKLHEAIMRHLEAKKPARERRRKYALELSAEQARILCRVIMEDNADINYREIGEMLVVHDMLEKIVEEEKANGGVDQPE